VVIRELKATKPEDRLGQGPGRYNTNSLWEPNGDTLNRPDTLFKPTKLRAFTVNGSPDELIVQEVSISVNL
jgi:hypothetical protein